METFLPNYQGTINSKTIGQNQLKKIKLPISINQKGCNFDTLLKKLYRRIAGNNIGNFKNIKIYNEVKPELLNYIDKHFEKVILNITPWHVANVLKQTRIRSGYSLKELEKITGFSKTSISHRESSSSSTYPNLSTLQIYLDSFNLTQLQFIYLVVLNVWITY